jgi:hypothetical protein
MAPQQTLPTQIATMMIVSLPLFVSILAIVSSWISFRVHSFAVIPFRDRRAHIRPVWATPIETTFQADDATKDASLNQSQTACLATKISQQLLNLLSTMKGQASELQQVEQWIQELEEAYQPPQTLGFFNWAQSGPWQFQFSTQFLNITQRRSFRLRQVRQDLKCHDFQGNITNTCLWELCQNDDGHFDCRGSFHIAGNYTLTSNGRLVWHPDSVERTLHLSPGSARPNNASQLVHWLQRSLAKELFDPTQHAVDTTYLDANVRIVRYSGPRFEGVRNVFVRTDVHTDVRR